jgi:hypothetical protein
MCEDRGYRRKLYTFIQFCHEFKITLKSKLYLKLLRQRGWGQGGEMNQALYAHMNNKRKREKINK